MLTRKKLGYAIGITAVAYLRHDLDELGAALRSGKRTGDELLEDSVEFEAEARHLGVPEMITKVLTQRADIFTANQRYREAITALIQADQALGSLCAYDLKVGIYVRRAEALGRLENWLAVVATCEEGIKLIETYRYKISGQYLQSAYLRSRIGLYSWGVRAAYECHNHGLMLEWAELSKCRSVLRYHQQQLTPAETLEQTEQEFHYICQQIDTVRAKDGGDVSERLLKKRRALWDLLLIQRAQARSIAPIPDFSLETVKSGLADDEAVLYYYWLDKQALLIAVIDRRQCTHKLQPITPQQRSDLEKFARFVHGFSPVNSPSYLDRVQNFASLLLPQWVKTCLQRKRRLLVSPHRLLHALPFHALRWSGENDYLIQRLAVTYVPNLTSLILRYPVEDRPRVLALGIRDYQVPGHTELTPLVDAELEVDELHRLYTERMVAISTRRGIDVTGNFLRQSAQTGELAAFTCLHFATHGINLDSDTPMESRLFLRDSILEGLEIANWRLGAQLVVLSACCSGQRAIRGRGLEEELPGDDMFGLQAAFFAAGAKQVLGSLWPVDSAAAREIMVACHRCLATGEAPEFALQAAVIGYLISARPARSSKLYYWAPFFLSAVGRPEKSTRVSKASVNSRGKKT